MLRAPVETSLQLSETGVITSPAWLAYFIRGLTPAVNTTTSGQNIADTASNIGHYNPTSYPVGTLYVETDRRILYWNTGAAWRYLDGTFAGALSDIPALGGNDSGFLFFVTDYGHLLRWDGSAWGWGPGDPGSGYFQDFAIPPGTPGWHACDGSNAPYLKSDGTLGTATLPNTAAFDSYRKIGASYLSGIDAATNPLLAMNFFIPSGTNSAPALAMDSFTPSGVVAAPVFTGTDVSVTSALYGDSTVVSPESVVVVIDGSGTVFTPGGTNDAPDFTGNAATLTGTVAAPVFTGAPAIPSGVISLPDDPVNHFRAIQYFRQ